ncbi:hypothetical protein B188_22400 [Candidatus Brocadiaceae bacterium B188]|nr:hypothetical protein [Candidatus Brocadia sapporoensis]QQR67227.1 MAG: hypothetical protein IPI25_03065 [Candidatus Brocadia sp.]TWU54244.1 hypothetical protein B188_22400 [Candidatus Brocadiaceae bacterium B188]
MYDITKFTFEDMIRCGEALQNLELKAKNVEDLANLIVHYFYDNLIDRNTGEKSCALVRFFMTYPYASLDEELRQLTDKALHGQTVPQEMKCLILLATAGSQTAWNSPKLSQGHRVLPLLDENMLKQNLMVYEFIYQMGIDASQVLNPDPNLALELENRIFNVYHVPDALGSPYIPAQDNFVIPFGIKSALGFGGMLPTGNLFAVIIFSKIKIPHNTADLFKNIALNAKMAVLPFVSEKIFVIDKSDITEEERLRSLITTQTSLLEMYKKAAIERSRHRESASLNIAIFLKTVTKKSWLYLSLVSVSALFLFVFYQTHFEFALHLAAIPLEIMLGALLIEKLLEKKEKAEKLRRIMYVKSYLYRSKLRNLFLTYFNALKFPVITISKIKNASTEELRQMRNDANHLEYQSLEEMEHVIMEYIQAYQVFYDFMERAIIHDVDSGFDDMVYVLHFIEDVKLFKQTNPDKPFIYEAQKQRLLMKKVKKIFSDGIIKFMDYMIELKEKNPHIFYDLLTDYELSSQRNTIVGEQKESGNVPDRMSEG